MPEDRNPFPQPNAIRRYTQTELIRRKKGPLAIPNPVVMPFVRFTSTKADPGPPKAYRFFHMGLHGLPVTEAAEGLDGFGNIFEMTYGGKDVVGYAFGSDGRRTPITSTDFALTKDDIVAEGRHPIPGVTNISVRHMGVNEPIQTTVNWVCYNTTQLEFLRQHFLMAGGYVIIEFGNYWSNREQPTLLDFSNHDEVLAKLTKFTIQGRKLMSDELFEPAQGNYNMVIGRVVDQSMTFESDGSIHCTTVFYSTGEAVFGVHNTRLLTGVSTEEGRELFSVTIHDFFSDNRGSGLNLLLADPRNSDKVITQRAKTVREIGETTGLAVSDADKRSYKSRFDSDFIPWSMFVRTVMERLFASADAQNVSADAALFTAINLDEPEVGNHHLLASTDPSTLVIVKPDMLAGSPEEIEAQRVDEQQIFARHVPGTEPIFVSADGTEEKGLLTNGIWINVGAIRDSFVQANTFYQGLMALLTRMNNAVENYWHLDLAFDEETQQYKIYDKKCVFGGKKDARPYLFNEDAEGELLDFSFEANFSKESKTAILLSNTQTRAEVDSENVSGFNQPSFWTGILNLPDLKDELGENIQAIRTEELRKSSDQRVIDSSPIFEILLADQTQPLTTVGLDRANALLAQSRALEADEEREIREGRERTRRIARFGTPMLPYIANSIKMIAEISRDGAANPTQINNFVAPIPTEINMSLKLTGINGFAFFDTFLVDKLPRIYSDHGMFLITEIQHSVDTNSGWTTTLGGIYWFTNPLGTGFVVDEAVASNAEVLTAGERTGRGAIPVSTSPDRFFVQQDVTRVARPGR